MADFLPEGVRVVRRGKLQGPSFGESSFTLYESCSSDLQEEAPCLLVWLHGQDMSQIPPGDVRAVQRRLGRRVFCLAPRNPEVAGGWRRFLWALGYTKAQNRNGLGFVFGELDGAFLESLSTAVREVAEEVAASHIVACGYSMGGFGAYQLGAHAPELYNAVVAIAGHGAGTLEPQDRGYRAPQPESSEVFGRFLEAHAPGLATVPLVLAVHARRDTVSLFHDAESIIEAVRTQGGCAELSVVPDEMADSDLGRKRKSRLGHSYYNYTLLHDTSEEVLYSRLRTVLSVEGRQAASTISAVPPGPTPESTQDALPGSKPCSAPPHRGPETPESSAPVARPAAPAKCGSGGLLLRVKARLRSSEGSEDAPAIRRLVDSCGLGDGVELALRMLAPEHVREILSGEEDVVRKLAEVKDADASMMWLVSQLDPEAAALVGRLQDLEGEATPEEEAEGEEEANDGAQDGDRKSRRSRSRSRCKRCIPCDG